jgi:HSP20 family protein
MFGKDSKELKVKEKQELSAPAEQTKPGPVFTPAVDIFENDKQIVLLADMPGVQAKALTIDLRENTLTLDGGVDSFNVSGEKDLIIEYGVGRYYRQFSLSEVIDQEKIDAQIKDGVLRLTLPKVAKAAPRTISVQAG